MGALVIVAVILGTLIWVNFDVRALRDDTGTVGGYTWIAWTFGLIVLWPVIFPYYLWERHKMPKPWERTPTERS